MDAMKIRHPWIIKIAGFLIASLVRCWIATLSYRYRWFGKNVDPHQPNFDGRYVYIFWHENMLLPLYHYGRADVWVLISQHADGQLITEVCHRMRFRTVSGSTTRGGVQAVRKMLRLSTHGHLAITPDGPRGPRRVVQPGLIYLASRTGLPIVPIGIGYHRPWRMNSWDRFALPRPFTRGYCITADPIVVPADSTREQLEDYRLRVEEILHRVSSMAEVWAQTGKWPGDAFGTRQPLPLAG
jgi:lysophospholipid acyltransferase (LPLAT)-like uncharacterized protein